LAEIKRALPVHGPCTPGSSGTDIGGDDNGFVAAADRVEGNVALIQSHYPDNRSVFTNTLMKNNGRIRNVVVLL
jgi:hypothetical protein